MTSGHRDAPPLRQAGAALLRLSAFGVAAVLVGLVLVAFAAGASDPEESSGVATLQAAVFFFGPIAGIAALAFIVIMVLTRPASLPHRRRAARAAAAAYAIVSALLAVLLMGTTWGLLIAAGSAVAACGSWMLLREPRAGTPDAAGLGRGDDQPLG